jgi:hypothetical protein
MNRARGRIEAVQPMIEGGRLRVRLTVCRSDGPRHFAFLPDRELSALLPRSILLTKLGDVPPQLLDTIEPILNKMVVGRAVRLWRYAERWYASFLSWRPVRFTGPL